MTKEEDLIIDQAVALLEGEHDFIANMANLSALLMMCLTDINWVGFYIYRKEELVLGPFQGKPACIRIPLNKGVCGKAASTRKSQCVPNVHQFPTHIACDSASQSEIVIPLIKDNSLIGVLDIDSPTCHHFHDCDIPFFERISEILLNTYKEG